MPPPKELEKALGEKRVTNYAGCGVSVGEAIDVESVVGSIPAGRC